MKKVLIIDDSIVYRHALTSALSEEKGLSVLGTAKNGQEALEFMAKTQVDLITVDIEMPVMNGLELIERLSHLPTKPRIIVFTSLDTSGANNMMKALQLGADDFQTKIVGSGDISESIAEIKDLLVPKIKSLLGVTEEIKKEAIPLRQNAPVIINSHSINKKIKMSYDYLFIGTSTGGPEALRFLFNDLNGKKMPPIFIVQHMPPLYTTYLAKALNEHTSYEVQEAKNGEIVKSGHCYIAPGDFHMSVVKNTNGEMKISLNQNDKECFVRPSVNVLFRSAKIVKPRSLFIILTGMGNDGLEGIRDLISSENSIDVLIQDESSSVVWGMPGEIFQKELYSEMLSLEKIKECVLKIV